MERKIPLLFVILTILISSFLLILYSVNQLRILAELQKPSQFGKLFDDSFYLDLAVKSNQSFLCKKIKEKNLREDCFWIIALALKDSSLCNKFFEENRKYLCQGLTSGDFEICQKITKEEQKNACLIEVARLRKEVSICEKTTSEDFFIFCRAIVLGQGELCQELELSFKRDECYLYVALNLKDLSLCEKIKDKIHQQTCLQELIKE